MNLANMLGALIIGAAFAIGNAGVAHANPDVVHAVEDAVGAPYVWGAAGPHAFDCSGLVVWAYRQVGINLPHSSQALARGGEPVARNDIQPGDVITYYPGATHAAIAIDANTVVHASRAGHPVVMVPLDAAGPFHNARRY